MARPAGARRGQALHLPHPSGFMPLRLFRLGYTLPLAADLSRVGVFTLVLDCTWWVAGGGVMELGRGAVCVAKGQIVMGVCVST